MDNKQFYADEIYHNENGDFYTGLALEHNEWLKDRYDWAFTQAIRDELGEE